MRTLLESLTIENLAQQEHIETLEESLATKDNRLSQLDQQLSLLKDRVDAVEKIIVFHL